MRGGFDLVAWQTFYRTMAAVAASLMGLLFVALSVHPKTITDKPGPRSRAREALSGFLHLLLISLLVLIPVQNRIWLGGELIGLAVVLLGANFWMQIPLLRELKPGVRLKRALRLVPFNLATALILVAGVTLLIGRRGGLLWLLPAVAIYLINAVVQAWRLTVKPNED